MPRWTTSPSDRSITLEQLPAKLAADGVDYAQYRIELKREIARQILRSRDVVQRIIITPRELDQYLEHQKKTASAANEYNVSHILIAVAQDAKPAQLAQCQQAGAKDVDDRARSGEDFGKLAVTYSAERNCARRRLARLAQGYGAADLPGRRHRAHETRRRQRHHADAQRLSHRKAQ